MALKGSAANIYMHVSNCDTNVMFLSQKNDDNGYGHNISVVRDIDQTAVNHLSVRIGRLRTLPNYAKKHTIPVPWKAKGTY